jgi:hypothetical protein
MVREALTRRGLTSAVWQLTISNLSCWRVDDLVKNVALRVSTLLRGTLSIAGRRRSAQAGVTGRRFLVLRYATNCERRRCATRRPPPQRQCARMKSMIAAEY